MLLSSFQGTHFKPLPGHSVRSERNQRARPLGHVPLMPFKIMPCDGFLTRISIINGWGQPSVLKFEMVVNVGCVSYTIIFLAVPDKQGSRNDRFALPVPFACLGPLQYMAAASAPSLWEATAAAPWESPILTQLGCGPIPEVSVEC